MNKPDICIYHGYCPDGFTSAWAIWKKFGDEIEYRHGSYGSPPPTVDGKHILLVDFSYKADVLREMAKKAASITILDHHKTAEADLKPLFNEGIITGVFDMEQSGAGLSWEWAHPGRAIPWLVRYIEDRDLWRFQYGEDTKNFCAAMDMHAMEFEEWDNVAKHCDNPQWLKEFIQIGSVLRKKQLKNCDHIIAATLHHIMIDGHRVPCCNCPHIYCSDIGNILAVRDDAPFSATFFLNKDGKYAYSLRSTDEKLDVSEIAAKFGGGGHRNASGFRTDTLFERVT